MKQLTWFLVVFSSIAILGILSEPVSDSSSLWGIVYGGLVIAQGVMVLNHLKEIGK